MTESADKFEKYLKSGGYKIYKNGWPDYKAQR